MRRYLKRRHLPINESDYLRRIRYTYLHTNISGKVFAQIFTGPIVLGFFALPKLITATT